MNPLLLLFLIFTPFIGIFLYFNASHLLSEHRLCQLKYILYVCLVMFYALILPPVYLFRPRNAGNIAFSAWTLNPLLRLFGFEYRVENGDVLLNDRPYVIVANHQSSVDFIGMMYLWPKYLRYCSILAKKELLWAGPFGPSSWLAGVEFVDRKNRSNSSATMKELMNKIKDKSLRLWIFPEGTRNMSETFLPFKLGAFRLAIEAQVPIVPVVFSSYEHFYNIDPKGKYSYWRRACVTIKCLEPIETKGMTLDNDLQRLTDLTRKRMLDAYLTIRTTSTTEDDKTKKKC